MSLRAKLRPAASVAAGLALVASAAPPLFAEPSGGEVPDDAAVSAEDATFATAADLAASATPTWSYPDDVESETGLWIVQFDGPSIAAYEGQLEEGTASTSGGALSVSAYAAQLADKHDAALDTFAQTLGRSVEPTFTYDNVLNGVAVEISTDEARELAALPDVVNIWPDDVRELQTDVSHEIILSDAIWSGDGASDVGTRGEGVIIGFLDTGVNPEHPSFAAESEDGYVHENPAEGYFGVCDPTNTSQANEDICNDKLIGAYSFNPVGASARDTDDHGSHVGSTIAGTAHTADVRMGTSTIPRFIEGVAPEANAISYLVCRPGCPGSASIASVNQAINDGVDVLNYSISGSDFPWQDAVDLAFLDAYTAGIVVAASAGNAGPGASTAAKSGPWNSATGATTHHRIFANDITIVGAGEEFEDLPAFPGAGPAAVGGVTATLVDAATTNSPEACSPFTGDALEGNLLLVPRGNCTFPEKVTAAQNAGAVGVVMYNNIPGPPTSPGGLDGTAIPTAMLSQEDGLAVKAYLEANPGTEASFGEEAAVVIDEEWIDYIAAFSSRGPSRYDMLLPTYAAPGVNILAAGRAIGDDIERYIAISGTSMSSPHAAGASALLVALYPDASPSEIRSILASTADYEGLVKEDGVTPTDPFDVGSGRINLDNASRAALSLHETTANFVAANPNLGGDPKTLNLPAFVDRTVEGSATWDRTVTNIAEVPVTYTAEYETPDGLTLAAVPATFTLEPGESVDLALTVTATQPTDGWTFGRLLLTTEDEHREGVDVVDHQFPVAVIATGAVAEPELTLDPTEITEELAGGTTSTQTLTIGNTGDAELEWALADGDGGPGPVTISHSTSNAIVANNSVACGAAGSTGFNSYLRHFALEDLGITGDLDVTEVSFGIETSGPATHDVSVNLYRLTDPNGPFTYANFTEIGTAAYTVSPVTGVVATVPVTGSVPAGGTLVVEVDVDDLAPVGSAFYIGSNDAGQTAPTYLVAPACGLTQPTPTGEIGFPGMHLVMSVTGITEADESCALPEWLSVNPTSGTVAPSGSTEVEVSFDATGLADGEYTASICLTSNDPLRPTASVPVTLTVGEVLEPPVIEVAPESITSDQDVDTVAEYALIVNNVGGSDLEFEIGEAEIAPVGDAPQGAAGPVVPQGTDRASAGAEGSTEAAPAQILPTVEALAVNELVENFDDITTLPAAGWAQINNSDPVGTIGWFQGNPASFPAHEGAENAYIAANFNNAGISPGNISNWLLTPELEVANGAEFTFWTRSSDSGLWADRLEVRLSTEGDSTNVGTGYEGTGDFTEVLTVVNENLVPDGYPQEWTEITVTVEGLSAPTTGRIGLRYFVPNGGPLGDNSDYIGIDTLSYTAPTEPHTCDLGTDIPWLSAAPDSGTVVPGGSADVTVSVDTTGLALGTHTAQLCVTSNDPATPLVEVPVSITVTEPPVVEPPSITVTPTTLEDTLEIGESATHDVVIGNTGGEDLTFTVAEDDDAAWVTVNPDSGTVAPDAETTVTASLDATGLAAGVYEATLVVASNDPETATVDVEVTLTVTAPDVELVIDRIYGANRYETAANISAATYEPGVEVVYLAVGTSYADALTGAALAGHEHAPVLLTRGDLLPNATAAELARLQPDRVVAFGSDAAIQNQVLTSAGVAAGTSDVTRLEGANRYETAAAIAGAFGPADTVYIASGEDFPDALAGAALAGAQGGPLLLTRSDWLPAATAAQIALIDPDNIVVFGSDQVIDDEIVELLGAFAPTVRVEGDDRYETAVAVSEFAYEEADTVYVALGQNWPDALVGAALAGANEAPLLLVQSDHLPSATGAELERLGPSEVVVFGGPNVIEQVVLDAIAALDIP